MYIKIEYISVIIRNVCFSHAWDLFDYCEEVQREYEAKGFVHLRYLPNNSFENMSDEQLDYRLRMSNARVEFVKSEKAIPQKN